MEEYPWLEIANSLIGDKEVSGTIDNPKIVEMFRLVGNVEIKDDETAWCAAFVGACLELSGFRSTRSVSARSYQRFGRALAVPEKGCIAVFWRGSKSGRLGHVGFFDHADGDFIYVLGGNQGNSVRIAAYPAKQLLGYVMPENRSEVASSPLIANIDQIRAQATQTSGQGGEAPTTVGGVPSDGIAAMDGRDPGFDGSLEDDADMDTFAELLRGLLGDEDVNDDPVPPPAIELALLQRDSQGPAVRDLQQKLVEKGFALGAVDGNFGAMTESAVFEFQRANRLEGNGVVDRATMEALFGGRRPEIADDRRNADQADLLRKGSVIMKQARQGDWTAAGAGVLALLGVADTLDVAKLFGATGDSNLFSQLLGADGGLWVLLAAAGIFGWRKFDAAAERRVSDHNRGLNRRI